jgi:phage virion morphogenesis protein
MSGATFTITFDDRQVARALRGIALLGRNPAGMLGAIRTGLLRNTQDRFDAESAPDGSRWATLHPLYASDKRGPGILRESGMRGGLQGSLTGQVEGNSVVIGSNKIYAAVHQFGATITPKTAKALVFRMGGQLVTTQRVTIPARPYLGLSARDEETIMEAAEDALDAVLRRA